MKRLERRAIVVVAIGIVTLLIVRGVERSRFTARSEARVEKLREQFERLQSSPRESVTGRVDRDRLAGTPVRRERSRRSMERTPEVPRDRVEAHGADRRPSSFAPPEPDLDSLPTFSVPSRRCPHTRGVVGGESAIRVWVAGGWLEPGGEVDGWELLHAAPGRVVWTRLAPPMVWVERLRDAVNRGER